MIFPKFSNSVGVAPGTTMLGSALGRRAIFADDPRGCCDGGNVPDDCCQSATMLYGLGNACGSPGQWPPPPTNPFPFPERSNFYLFDPWARYEGRRWVGPGLGAIPRASIRWDIIATVGGGSLAIALMIGLIASALSK